LRDRRCSGSGDCADDRGWWSEGHVVGETGDAPDDEAVASDGGSEGPRILDHEDGCAKRGRLIVMLVLHLRINGSEGEDRGIDGGVEDCEAGELGCRP